MNMIAENTKKYKIVENIEDHVGYNGEEVSIKEKLTDNYLIVENEAGESWYVGEEEIEEVK